MNDMPEPPENFQFDRKQEDWLDQAMIALDPKGEMNSYSWDSLGGQLVAGGPAAFPEVYRKAQKILAETRAQKLRESQRAQLLGNSVRKALEWWASLKKRVF